jgi:putative transposase
MPRHARVAPAGLVYHVLNRSVGRMQMFRRDADFEAFERILIDAHQRHPIRILSYCIMSNHWHFVVWPDQDGQVTDFFRAVAQTHAIRWRVSHRTVGYGHLYQGRFKCFPIQRDAHQLTVCRYVERNALAAGLVRRAERWRWSSLWARMHGSDELKGILSPWPRDIPRHWLELVNTAMAGKDVERMRLSMQRSRPFGDDAWVARTAARLDLEHTIRPEGRPRKQKPR